MFEGVGLGVISGNSLVLLGGGLVLLAVGLLCTKAADQEHFSQDHRAFRNELGHRLVTSWTRLAQVTVALALVALIGTVVTRERVIFFGGQESARQVLGLLAQFQGTVGVLGITVGFILAQVASSEVSLRASLTLARHRLLVFSGSLLALSVLWDVFCLARVDDLLSSGKADTSFALDLSLLLALAATAGVGVFLWEAPRLLSLEALVQDALKGFNTAWLRRVEQDWRSPMYGYTLRIRDPIVLIERILRSALEKGDHVSFDVVISLLSERLRSIVGPTQVAAVDNYLRHYLRELVLSAAKRDDTGTLLGILQLGEAIGDTEAKEKLRTIRPLMESEAPAGESLLRFIVTESIVCAHGEPAESALRGVERRARLLIPVLPNADDTYMLHPNRDDETQIWTDEERRPRFDNDNLVIGVEQCYLQYLSEVACEASRKKALEVGSTATFLLTLLLGEAVETIPDAPLRARILRTGLYCLDTISTCLCQIGSGLGFNSVTERLARGLRVETDQQLANEIAVFLTKMLKDHSGAGVLGYMQVVDAAMTGLEFGRKFPEAQCKLIFGMGEAAALVGSHSRYASSQEYRLVYKELVQRIRQQGTTVTDQSAKMIRETIRTTLVGLGE